MLVSNGCGGMPLWQKLRVDYNVQTVSKRILKVLFIFFFAEEFASAPEEMSVCGGASLSRKLMTPLQINVQTVSKRILKCVIYILFSVVSGGNECTCGEP